MAGRKAIDVAVALYGLECQGLVVKERIERAIDCRGLVRVYQLQLTCEKGKESWAARLAEALGVPVQCMHAWSSDESEYLYVDLS